MSGPGFSIPNPPNGFAGTPADDLESAKNQFYGFDIWFDVATADPVTGYADYVVTPAGDITTVDGIVALQQSLVRRLITNPGEWAWLPDYGVGARQYVKQPNTPANQAALEARIRSQFLSDARVESVSAVSIVPLADDGTFQINVSVVAAGRLRQDQPLPVSIVIG